MTTYEQELINRISEQEILLWLLNNRPQYSEESGDYYLSYQHLIALYQAMKSKDKIYNFISYLYNREVINKSIIELCYEIKPITIERLNKITIEQWKKICKKYKLKFIKQYENNFRITGNNYNDSTIYFDYNLINENNDFTIIQQFTNLIAQSNKKIYWSIGIDFIKSIHDFVWELENI